VLSGEASAARGENHSWFWSTGDGMAASRLLPGEQSGHAAFMVPLVAARDRKIELAGSIARDGSRVPYLRLASDRILRE